MAGEDAWLGALESAEIASSEARPRSRRPRDLPRVLATGSLGKAGGRHRKVGVLNEYTLCIHIYIYMYTCVLCMCIYIYTCIYMYVFCMNKFIHIHMEREREEREFLVICVQNICIDLYIYIWYPPKDLGSHTLIYNQVDGAHRLGGFRI